MKIIYMIFEVISNEITTTLIFEETEFYYATYVEAEIQIGKLLETSSSRVFQINKLYINTRNKLG